MSSSNLNSHDKKPVEEYLKRADTIMDKRFLYFAYSVLGKNTELQLQNGTKAKGKFHTASIDNGGVVIKNFAQPESGNNNLPTKVLDVKDFVYILVSDVEEPPLIKPKKSEFKTDTEISKNKLDDRRTFVKWGEEGNDLLGSTGGMTLEESAHEKGKWNQFEMNEKRFGLRSNYEENMYTTHLDMKNVSASLLEKATRLEAEILNNAADLDNRHIREERGLQELKEDEDEEFLYSSVYRTDPKKDKKGDSKADEERKPKFTNSKKNPTTTPATTTTTTTTPAAQPTTQKSESLAPPQASTENKKEPKPLEVSSNRRDFVPSGGMPAFNGSSDPKATKPAANERTPKASDLPDTQTLNRQASNVSDDALRKKGSLSVSSGAFGNFDTETKKEPLQVQIPEKKDETKAAPSKQGSIELDTEKKVNLLTPADFHSALTTKFKLKITDKEIKRSSVSFFEYATPNWQKKPIVTDPSAVNVNWKAAKAQALNQVASKAITPTSQPTTTTSTPKLSQKPNTNAPPFNAGSTMPANNFGGGMMMGQMGQPFIPGGYPQPQFMNPGMQFMPPMQKFTPGFPMPQPTMPMYGMPGYVDPNQPTFNMGMNYHPQHGNGPRQGGPGNRNFNKNKQ